MIPADIFRELSKRSGEYGLGQWNGFAFARIGGNGFALLYIDHTVARIWQDKIEIYIDEKCSTLNRQNFCNNNTPYHMKFDIRSGGKDVRFGQTYFLKIDEKEYKTKTGVRIDAEGTVALIDPLVEAIVDKAKAKKVLALVRERLKVPFATARLLGIERTTHEATKQVSDIDVITAVVEDNTASLTNSSLTVNWRGQKNYERETRNFISRCKGEIYEAFGCFEPAA